MVVVRFIFRLIIFLVGVGAIFAIIGGGIYFYLQNSTEAGIVVAEGVSLVGRNPEDLEDVAVSLLLQSRSEEINTPLSDDPTAVPFVVEQGETASSIGSRLQTMGFITDAELFRRYLGYNGLDSSLEAGDYELRRNMNMVEIANALQKAKFDEVAVTIPEGLRAEQVAEILAEAGIMDAQQFVDFVRAGVGVDHPLLRDRPAGASYEGYLFPDTYRLAPNTSPADLVSRMLDNFQARLPSNIQDLATRRNLNLYQMVIIASIVEREAVHDEERPTIASVYLNRLKPDSPEPYLRADPTVQYAMGYQVEADQWWKTPVSLEEYSAVDSPYNTYLYPGMPPGPIASPGVRSVMGVIEAEETPYLYFVAFENGFHVFAETYEEHQQNVSQYQGQ
ncbi:MAG: endolytic transglycosylase MltG [Chloroflexota bacterium]